MKKRGQAWGFDLMIAAILFLSGIIIFYIYSLNYPTEGQEALDSLFYEGNFIADSLLSEGHPNDWNKTNVIKIGLLNKNKVNETKLERLYYFSESEYQKTRALLNTKYDYFFNFSDNININGTQIEGIGTSIISNPENLIKISRLTIYQNKPTTLNVYIWD